MTARVEEILGFSTSEFIEKVCRDVDDEVESCVEALKKDLLRDSKLKELSPEELEIPLELLRKKLKKQFNKNLDKFEIYANRNIFVLSDEKTGEAIIPTDLNSMSSELVGLHDQYLILKEKYNQIVTNVTEYEQVLSEIKTVIFNLRVGAQVFDELEPLDGTAATLSKQKNDLDNLVKRANGKSIAVQLHVLYACITFIVYIYLRDL